MANRYIVDLNKPALSLRREPVKDESGEETTLGKITADHIGAAASDKNVIKLIGWAWKMYEGSPLDLDSEDYNQLKAFIELLPRMPVLIKGQVLEIFNSTKSTETSPKASDKE